MTPGSPPGVFSHSRAILYDLWRSPATLRRRFAPEPQGYCSPPQEWSQEHHDEREQSLEESLPEGGLQELLDRSDDVPIPERSD